MYMELLEHIGYRAVYGVTEAYWTLWVIWLYMELLKHTGCCGL